MEVKALQLRGEQEVRITVEEAHASVGSRPPPSLEPQNPAVLTTGKHKVWGDSGSCLATPHKFIPVGAQLPEFVGEWRNTKFYQTPGVKIDNAIDMCRRIRMVGGSESEAESMVEDIPPSSNGPWHVLQTF